MRDLLDDHEILHDDVAEIQIHRDLASGADARISERVLDRQRAGSAVVETQKRFSLRRRSGLSLDLLEVLEDSELTYVRAVLGGENLALSGFVVVVAQFNLVVGLRVNRRRVAEIPGGVGVNQQIELHRRDVFKCQLATVVVEDEELSGVQKRLVERVSDYVEECLILLDYRAD